MAAGQARGWAFRAMNKEPALFFSAVFGVGALAIPLIGQLSGRVPTEIDDSVPYGYRYHQRKDTPEFDADTFMAFYRGKNEYRSAGPPENSTNTKPPPTRLEWLQISGNSVPAPKPWILPDLGYTQSRAKLVGNTKDARE